MSGLATRLGTRRWGTVLKPWSLTRQFAVTGSAIMLLAMIVEGAFTAEIISRNTIDREAATTALFMDSFFSPLGDDLAVGDILSAEKRVALDRLLSRDDFRSRFPHVEIWKDSGLVAYSTTPELVGRRFPRPAGLVAAWAGQVSARFTDLNAAEHAIRGFTSRYLEIYAPIREPHTGRIVAVAEIHEIPEPLEQRLRQLRLSSWLARIAVTALIMIGLFWIVYRGNGIIMAQQRQLSERMADIERTSRHNRILRERIQRASGRVSELNERFLRGLGADLHDGPAQLIGLASLKVEHVRLAGTALKREEELHALDSFLAETLREIRAISKGLILPEIESLPLREVVRRAACAHEQRTGTVVAVRCEDISQTLPDAVKMCVYRFIQEGLNNAFRHAGGNGQSVTCKLKEAILCLAVEDGGGCGRSHSAGSGSGLGLVGLRERVQSLGGTFRMSKVPDGGTKIEMTLAMVGGGQDE